VLQIADIYDALTTARPYKRALSKEEAFAILEAEAHRGWRDAELVPLFQQSIEKFGAAGSLGADWADDAGIGESLENMRRELLK
jgi:HD-GYP domain-containing protein (c-di-GMP phosphodiesterase class II)